MSVILERPFEPLKVWPVLWRNLAQLIDRGLDQLSVSCRISLHSLSLFSLGASLPCGKLRFHLVAFSWLECFILFSQLFNYSLTTQID